MILDQLGINPVYLIAQIVNFGILFFVLSKLLYKPLLKMLDERAKKINLGIKAAQESVKLKENFEIERKNEMAKARKEMDKIITAANEEARKIKNDIVSEAKKEAQSVTEKEYEKIKQKLEIEEKEMKQRIGEETIKLSREILQKVLGKTVQKELFSAQILKLKKVKVN